MGVSDCLGLGPRLRDPVHCEVCRCLNGELLSSKSSLCQKQRLREELKKGAGGLEILGLRLVSKNLLLARIRVLVKLHANRER